MASPTGKGWRIQLLLVRAFQPKKHLTGTTLNKMRALEEESWTRLTDSQHGREGDDGEAPHQVAPLEQKRSGTSASLVAKEVATLKENGGLQKELSSWRQKKVPVAGRIISSTMIKRRGMVWTSSREHSTRYFPPAPSPRPCR
jgi:hypothetical protein